MAASEMDTAIDDEVGDDLLRLMFTACHPMLTKEARVALTLRLLGGLTTDEIARAFLVPESTVAQRIVRAKRTLAEARVPFEVPRGPEFARTLVVGAGGDLPDLQRGLYGDRGRRLDAAGTLRRRAAAGAHSSRACAAGARGARPGGAHGDSGVAFAGARRPDGEPILLLDQNRALWDRLLIRRGLAALARAGQLATTPGLTRCRPRSPRVMRARGPRAETDWPRIAELYGRLAELTPSPIVELNRAVALGMAFGPGSGSGACGYLVIGTRASELPPAAERSRRLSCEAGPSRRSSCRVRARGDTHEQRART